MKILLEPREPGEGFAIRNEISSGVIPEEYIPSVTQGILEAAQGGILAGYEVVDFRATLYDGSYHEVDSNEMAFRIAGSLAFKEAALQGSPVLLEPVMAVEVTVPEKLMGTIIGDINSRRGRIEGVEHVGDSLVIKARAPLHELLGYEDWLHSRFQDRVACAIEFLRYEPAPHPGGSPDESLSPVRRPDGPTSRTDSAAADPDFDWT